MEGKTAISLDNVSLVLAGPHGPVNILQKISLDVKPGETLSIVGASGSGKTSLMMVLAGVEKSSAGRIIVAGEDISDYSEDQLAAFRQKHVGIVFQNFHLIPTMTAAENVALGLEFAGEDNALERAAEALAALGLAERADHYPSQLSGGEQQRVALARATVTRPSILLADEPTGNLDSETGQKIIELLFGLQREHGTTLVLITHDKALAVKASRQLVMQDGTLHEAHRHSHG
ncbi:MAG: ATP-binding cassette domain-containing protein [Alphaproteobacteria bacterium]|nr:ATP-binding cassette domain-containing protein [Alphaproteobacteria bacterium]